jgi:hypothetical protein
MKRNCGTGDGKDATLSILGVCCPTLISRLNIDMVALCPCNDAAPTTGVTQRRITESERERKKEFKILSQHSL